jgi:hypothetical protein
MQSDLIVYTSITGGKDTPVEAQNWGKAHWIAFNDKPLDSAVWERREAYNRFKDDRRNSRAPKILAHQFLDTKYSIWIDGNCSLLRPPEELIEKYLIDHDIAVFKHPERDCIYGEAIKCAKAGLDDPEVIIEQVSAYEKRGYQKEKGLCECMMIMRRHTRKVEEFNNAWFSEWTRHSVRDQISFMYAADKVGIRVRVIDLPWHLASDGLAGLRGNFFKIEPHIISNPTVL